MNFAGIGITMPHKQNVLNYLDEVSKDASVMGAVTHTPAGSGDCMENIGNNMLEFLTLEMKK